MPITKLCEEVAHHAEEGVIRHLWAETATVLVIEVAPSSSFWELEVEVAIATVKRLPQLVIVGVWVGRVLSLGGARREHDENEGEEKGGEELHIRRAQE